MSTLSQFFGSASTGGGTQTTSTMRVFTQTGSLTLPSDTVYVAYGAMGGGGQVSGANYSGGQNRSGGGGGFAFKEGAHSGAGTVCAIVGAQGAPCECCMAQMKNQGGTSCVSGFTPGTICATGGCCCNPGCGVGGDINTCGGMGGFGTTCLGGAGAGGLYGNGGSPMQSTGGGGFGSGGGGGAGSRGTNMDNTCSDYINAHNGIWNGCPNFYNAQGGGGGQPGSEYNGGYGLAGTGGVNSRTEAPNSSGGTTFIPPGVGYIPQYTRCGYSQAKTYFAAAGGGGARTGCVYCGGDFTNTHGAPGGGGGGVSGQCANSHAGNGGFGAGGGGGWCSAGGGQPGFGGGSSTMRAEDSSNLICGGFSGQGVVAVEYWVG